MPVADCDYGLQAKASPVVLVAASDASHHERNSFEREPEARVVVEIRRWVASFALSFSVGLVFVSLAKATQLRSAGVQGWLQVAAIETPRLRPTSSCSPFLPRNMQMITLVSRL